MARYLIELGVVRSLLGEMIGEMKSWFVRR